MITINSVPLLHLYPPAERRPRMQGARPAQWLLDVTKRNHEYSVEELATQLRRAHPKYPGSPAAVRSAVESLVNRGNFERARLQPRRKAGARGGTRVTIYRRVA